ncbi:hypothetical protein MMC26_001055 [Xylographa opegraphella]|nr:hypothetical protein [Xylographa opegraphella]
MTLNIASSSLSSALTSIAALTMGLVVTFSVKLYKARFRMIELRKQGLAMPPHSFLFGHLLVVKAAVSGLPSDAYGNYIPRCVRAMTPELGPIFYIDLWPLGPQMLVVSSPDGLHQMTQEHSLPKFHALRKFLSPMSGEFDLVTMEGEMWKRWRNIFNPGFSPSNLLNFVPAIVEETTTFCAILQAHVAQGDIVRLKTLTDNLTMDVIGRVILDIRLNSQRTINVMASSLRRMIPWLTFGAEPNPLDRFNPLRPLAQWYYARQMNTYLSPILDARFAALRTSNSQVHQPVIDLAMLPCLTERDSKDSKGLDAALKTFILAQTKLLLFSGHDTTSATICYVFYLLARHPSILARIRAEHDSVFGSDNSHAADQLTQQPHLLHQLLLTTAVIKETLRLFPPSSTTRGGEQGFAIVDHDTGLQYPTNGFMVWSSHDSVHHDPALWKRAADFLPDRWLVSLDDPLHPVKGAWRPFEHGLRNCIGQELTMLEVKIVLVMTLRTFDIVADYGARTEQVDGEKAYQTGIGSPCLGLPCRITNFVR